MRLRRSKKETKLAMLGGPQPLLLLELGMEWV